MTTFNEIQAGDVRLRRLFWLRNISVAGQVLAIVVVHALFGIELPLIALALVIGVLMVVNVATAWRLTGSKATGDLELFGQLAADVLLLTAALYLTGGATNPFVSLYLLPLVVAATILPVRHALAMAALTASTYSLLMFWYRPLAQVHIHQSDAFGLHVLGMWFNFMISAGLIAFFVARMAVSLRERERELANARERALRDEHLVTLGTFAVGAAHELSTPLSSIAVLVQELDGAGASDLDARRDIATLRTQVDVCKRILSDLVDRAGRARSEGARLRSLSEWVDEAATRFRVLRPTVTLRVVHARAGSGPLVAAEETAVQALVSLLNNAADASPDEVELFCDWNEQGVALEIRDRGPGITAAAVQRAGRVAFSDKSGRGMGYGLLLANAAIERLGGQLDYSNRADGGAVIRVRLPIEVAP